MLRIKKNTGVTLKNYAFIDAQNLHMAIEKLGWKVDYKRFHTYLKEHYKVQRVYMFMGFKPILELKNGHVKGNCDAELVLQVMIDFKHYDQAVIVSGDGDFHCLIKYLQEKKKLKTVLVPSADNCSILIKRLLKGNLTLVSDLRRKIEYKKKQKRPRQDKT